MNIVHNSAYFEKPILECLGTKLGCANSVFFELTEENSWGQVQNIALIDQQSFI